MLMVWCAAYGYTLEKVAYKPLRAAPRLSPLISAIGMTICGINRPRNGEIFWYGKPINHLPSHEIVKLGISQVPEGRLIFPDLSVSENLDLGAFLRRDPAGVKDDLDYVFSLFPILSERRKQAGGTLSGGEQQMLAISRALMARPKLLLLDEPSLGLAPIIIQQIFSIIEKVNADGTTVFLVEQNANQALRIANHGYVMENGRIVMLSSALRTEALSLSAWRAAF